MEDCGGGNTDCAVEGIITVYLSSSLSLSDSGWIQTNRVWKYSKRLERFFFLFLLKISDAFLRRTRQVR